MSSLSGSCYCLYPDCVAESSACWLHYQEATILNRAAIFYGLEVNLVQLHVFTVVFIGI